MRTSIVTVIFCLGILTVSGCKKAPEAASGEVDSTPAIDSGSLLAQVQENARNGEAPMSNTVFDAKNSVGFGFPSVPDEAREFKELSEDDLAELKRLTLDFWRTDDPATQEEILSTIEAAFYGVEVIEFLNRVVSLGDESLKLKAINILAGNVDVAILPTLEKALDDPSEEIRMSAVMAAGKIRDKQLADFVAKAFEDNSENVRIGSFDVLEGQTVTGQMRILDRALKSTHADVQTAAIGELAVTSTHDAVEVLFSALDSPIDEVREDAQFQIDFMLDKELATAEEARAWWKANSAKYDQDLVLID